MKLTRIAPTPSGFLHLGNVLSFALTAALGRKNNVQILLRIDDMDQARAGKTYVQDIFDTLNFLGIPWNEGPLDIDEFEATYSQLHRMDHYNEALEQLKNDDLVFACTCSRRQMAEENCKCLKKIIPLDTQNAAWRLKTDSQTVLKIKNYTGDTIRAHLPEDMQNFIIRKKDGYPAYQLTSVTDDLFYGVDLIIRGLDLWPSTLAQHVLARALGKNNFGDITFFHHPLITEPSGRKLSKSAGATSINYLRQNGQTAAGIFRLVASAVNINEPVDNWQQFAQAYLDRFAL